MGFNSSLPESVYSFGSVSRGDGYRTTRLGFWDATEEDPDEES